MRLIGVSTVNRKSWIMNLMIKWVNGSWGLLLLRRETNYWKLIGKYSCSLIYHILFLRSYLNIFHQVTYGFNFNISFPNECKWISVMKSPKILKLLQTCNNCRLPNSFIRFKNCFQESFSRNTPLTLYFPVNPNPLLPFPHLHSTN